MSGLLIAAFLTLADFLFRYVAMHSMQHCAGSLPSEPAHMDGAYEDGILAPFAGARGSSKRTDVVDVALMVVGMLLPLLTQIGHAHAHGD